MEKLWPIVQYMFMSLNYYYQKRMDDASMYNINDTMISVINIWKYYGFI